MKYSRISPLVCRLCVVALLGVFVCGCENGQIDRYGVSGSVSYRGEPVPSGQVSFMPDRSRGNKGPQGFAEIVDGRYEIDSEQGTIAGPVLVVISGADGKDRDDERSRPYGNWLFNNHKVAVDIEPGGKEMDFDVP